MSHEIAPHDHNGRSKKRCRHSPSCYKFLITSTRKKHYAAANADKALCSDFGSSDSDDDQISSPPTQSAHIDLQADADGPSDLDEPSDLELFEAYAFREDDVCRDEDLSGNDEMIAILEDWQGPTKAEELHSLRECCFGWGSIIA